MASSHSSSPVPQSNSSDAFFKKEVDATKRFHPVQSLPDVCPKEPTGNTGVQGEGESSSVCWTIGNHPVNISCVLGVVY